MEISFGKYSGRDITTVPSEYLTWLAESCRKTNDAITEELARRERVESANMSTAERIVQAGFRTLVKEAHPDTGGPVATAAATIDDLTMARELLRDLIRLTQTPADDPPRRKGPQGTPPPHTRARAAY